MIDSREYPPEELENQCSHCGEDCEYEYCNNECKKADIADN